MSDKPKYTPVEIRTLVEVVRCEECKHGRTYNHTKEYVSCEVDCDPIDRDSDFFCKYGERRE